MAFIDYYKILGIDKGTPQEELRSAYKRRAKQFHPDLHPNDPKAKAKFQALNEAYEVLNDPKKRAQYDQYGANWKNAEAYEQQRQAYGQGGANPFYSSGGGFDSFSNMNGGFSSIFEDLFGRSNSRRRNCSNGCHHEASESQDSQATINIDIYTAILGGEVTFRTSNGTFRLKVKKGTQNGSKVKLKGKGRVLANGTQGDLILTYNVTIPTNLSAKQEQLLREMQQG